MGDEISYEEWVPPLALRGIVTAFWRVTGMPTPAPASVLPDGHVEIVINLGSPVRLDGPAFRGNQPARCVVGLLSRALRIEYGGPIDTFGIRLHPAWGGPFFGVQASQLVDTLAPVARIDRELDRALARELATGANPAADATRNRLAEIVVAHARRGGGVDALVARIVDRLADQNESTTIEELAELANVSARQLQRRFVDAVGIAPKRFVRVLRFARAWQVASMQPEASWADLAAEHGYADQAHLIREFRTFGASPPTRIFTRDWYAGSKLARATGPARGVRFVQESGNRAALRSSSTAAPSRGRKQPRKRT